MKNIKKDQVQSQEMQSLLAAKIEIEHQIKEEEKRIAEAQPKKPKNPMGVFGEVCFIAFEVIDAVQAPFKALDDFRRSHLTATELVKEDNARAKSHVHKPKQPHTPMSSYKYDPSQRGSGGFGGM